MDFFQWQDSFNIGISKIDQQHRRFLEYLNECYHSVMTGDGVQTDPKMIFKLKGYAATHFRFEEGLMTKHGYPKYETHILQHDYYVGQIAKLEIAIAIAKETEKAPEDLFEFMRDWFLNHILEEDQNLSRHLKSTGP